MSAGAVGQSAVRHRPCALAFDTEPAPVYVDDCCHYTARGNEILADVVLGAALASRPEW